MKRIFFALLLLAGIGFACEKNDSDILDQSQIVESKKQDLASNLVTLTQSSGQLSADDLHKLKAFKNSNPAINGLPSDLPELSVNGEAWYGLVEKIAGQVKELSTMMPHNELESLVREVFHKSTNALEGNPTCAERYEWAMSEAAIDFFRCHFSDTNYNHCIYGYMLDIGAAVIAYEECDDN
jgi:hypothetical protein